MTAECPETECQAAPFFRGNGGGLAGQSDPEAMANGESLASVGLVVTSGQELAPWNAAQQVQRREVPVRWGWGQTWSSRQVWRRQDTSPELQTDPLTLLAGLAVVFVCMFILATGAAALGGSPGAQNSTPEDPPVLDADLGRQAFLRYCRECHGEAGDGLGKFSYTTGERPRSFQSGRFKLATTENAIPSDRDLEETIRRGMPGTGMSAWGQVPDAEIAAMARHVRSFSLEAIREELDRKVSSGELSAAEAEAEFERRTTPGPAIEMPPEPPFDEERRARGERLYLEACASCHGPNGRRLRNDPMPDFEGNHTLPTDIAGGIFKGGRRSSDIYSRLYIGMDGTAMPGYGAVYGKDEIWDLVHTVERIISDGGLGLPEDAAAIAAAAETTEDHTAFFDGTGYEEVPDEEARASPFLLWGGGALLFLVLVGSALLTARR